MLAINVPLQHAPNLRPARLPLTSNASEDWHDHQSKPLQGVATPTIIFIVSLHSSMFIVVRSIAIIIQTAHTVAL